MKKCRGRIQRNAAAAKLIVEGKSMYRIKKVFNHNTVLALDAKEKDST